MKLELYLSDQAKRQRFVAGASGDDPVLIDVAALDLQPYTRALLFDTFGDGDHRIDPTRLRVDAVPRSDWQFHHLVHAYRAASARQRWWRRTRCALGLGAAVGLLALLSSPLLGPGALVLLTVALYGAIAIVGMALA